ncbi:MAG TPA: hypothetical protein DCK99_00710, partial [Blastocatellia bacterium]|nr:hypothetical protein [Blastocatellia bacterium]
GWARSPIVSIFATTASISGAVALLFITINMLIKICVVSLGAKIDIRRDTMTERCSAPADPGYGTFAKSAAPGLPRDVVAPTPITGRQICGLADQ